MPTSLQLRRGTTAENAAFTGAAGELTVDTQTNGLNVHDGSTAGGAAISGGGASALTTKGDVATFSTVDARLPVGTNDQVLTADSAEATGVKWADAAGGTDFAIVNARHDSSYLKYAHNILRVDSTGIAEPVANTLHFFPVWFLAPTTITQLGFDVTTIDAASTDTRVGIWTQHGTTGLPSTLLEGSGHIDVSTTGITTYTLGTPLVLAPGAYWCGMKSDSVLLKTKPAAAVLSWGDLLGIGSTSKPRQPVQNSGPVGALISDPASLDLENSNYTRVVGYV